MPDEILPEVEKDCGHDDHCDHGHDEHRDDHRDDEHRRFGDTPVVVAPVSVVIPVVPKAPVVPKVPVEPKVPVVPKAPTNWPVVITNAISFLTKLLTFIQAIVTPTVKAVVAQYKSTDSPVDTMGKVDFQKTAAAVSTSTAVLMIVLYALNVATTVPQVASSATAILIVQLLIQVITRLVNGPVGDTIVAESATFVLPAEVKP